MKQEVLVLVATTAAAALVGAGLLLRQCKHVSEQRWRRAQKILRKFARECATPVQKLWHVTNQMTSDMQAGLMSNGSDGDLRMLVSYLAPLPTGEEKGTFYGINLRGTNFLIVRAKLGGKNEPVSEIRRQEIPIPSEILANGESSKELFDHIAVELAKFMSVNHSNDGEESGGERKLGFTVSIAVDEFPASAGIANKWNSLYIDETVGKQLAGEINQSLEKHGVELRVSAVVNDTVGHLAGGRYYNKETVAAVTLAMGTDVAYIESPQVILNPPEESQQPGETVYNMQWGDFASSHLPLTEYDTELDAVSTNPGGRTFEKLVSGMYLGEIVRRVLLKMAQEAELFGDSVPPKLTTPYLLWSPDMAAMHQDTSEDYEVVREKLFEIFEINNTNPMVRETVSEVCDVVAERGARLVGAGIVGIVKKLGRVESKKSVITIEGGLYEHYRVFRNYLHSSVWEMLGSDLADNVIIEHSHGGSGAGSIFLAASQSQMQDVVEVPNVDS